MFLVGVIAGHDISRARKFAVNKIKSTAITARIAPGPDVGLAGVLEYVVPGTFDLVGSVRAKAKGKRIRPMALVPAGVRPDLVPVADRLFEARPQGRYWLNLGADEDGGFDAILVEGVDASWEVSG